MYKYLASALILVLASCGENAATGSQPQTAETETPPVEAAEANSTENQTSDNSKTARCVIRTSDQDIDKSCRFKPDGGGSFALSDMEDGELISGITMVNVTIFAKGEAEVRGLTTDGINSRWGIATRSETDPACWVGSDFEICAY